MCGLHYQDNIEILLYLEKLLNIIMHVIVVDLRR